VKVHQRALTHGVSSEDAAQAAEWSLWIEPLDGDGPPERELRLGFNAQARLLETVVWLNETIAMRTASFWINAATVGT
jgi:hypothetical protein